MNTTVSANYQKMLVDWIIERDSKGDIHKFLKCGKLTKAIVRKDALGGCSRSVLESKDGAPSPCGAILNDYIMRLEKSGVLDLHRVNQDVQTLAEAAKRKDISISKQNQKISTLEAQLANIRAERDYLKEKLEKLEALDYIASSGKGVW
jgi:hypothetical protein